MHCSDDDLVLHYYGDPDTAEDVAAHVTACVDCGARYREIAAALRAVVLPEAPELGDRYAQELWQRIAPRLGASRPLWHSRWVRPLALATAASLLLATGFVVGRRGRAPEQATVLVRSEPGSTDAARRRVLLLSVTDHLERSDRVLTDVINATSADDISAERQWAEELVSANRIYRQDAVDSDEHSMAAVLDDLERALLDIVHSPSRVTQDELDRMHRRLDSAALLFKVRVLGGELRERQRPLAPPSMSSVSRVS